VIGDSHSDCPLPFRYGLDEHLPFYRVGEVCPYELVCWRSSASPGGGRIGGKTDVGGGRGRSGDSHVTVTVAAL